MAAKRKRKRKQVRGRARKALEQRDRVKCLDLDRIKSLCERTEEGCWIWTGAVKSPFCGDPVPMIRGGHHAAMRVDKAVWESVTGERVEGRTTWMRKTCGKSLCVSPGHLRKTNHVLEVARKKLGLDL